MLETHGTIESYTTLKAAIPTTDTGSKQPRSIQMDSFILSLYFIREKEKRLSLFSLEPFLFLLFEFQTPGGLEEVTGEAKT